MYEYKSVCGWGVLGTLDIQQYYILGCGDQSDWAGAIRVSLKIQKDTTRHNKEVSGLK